MTRTCAYCGFRDAMAIDADGRRVCRSCLTEPAGMHASEVEYVTERSRIVRTIRANPGASPSTLAEMLEYDRHGQPLRRIRQTAASEVRARRLVPYQQGWRAP